MGVVGIVPCQAWGKGHMLGFACRFARSKHFENGIDVVVVLPGYLVPSSANFINDWIVAQYSSSPCNSNGVQITGGRNPAARQTASIFSRTDALAIWAQFQVTRKSAPCVAAIAT